MTPQNNDRASGRNPETDEPTRVLRTDATNATDATNDTDDAESTRVLDLADAVPTRLLHADDDEYSATVLASHWIQRPEPETVRIGPPPTDPTDATDETDATDATEKPPTSPTPPAPPTLPDRVEGTVLRFGPGVTAAVANRTHSTPPVVPPPSGPPRRRLRRHALPALVLIIVIAFLAWQRLGPSIAARSVEVVARPTVLGCDATADIAALVTTNGRPGTLSYRWTRSDGTASGVLREEMVRGQKHASLHLLWTFQGKGHYTAQAELRLLSPTRRTVTTHFTYDCP
ncbi:hypothetical protein ACKI1I_01605 [Streptomyces turgidiscabies]|uniref:Ig-like domain-containing protein n=1 Tax=Streptomyces turgidiscabies (strain Car8) TaxID=698760 RepID=L7FFC9_STRT8|nr:MULTISPECIES: hypothetical protein [Streptomyces]ELP69390.1 hypothetical protein STRTUCAR8_05268 [Streptomyces turgidiscabies Car8]MDX3492406.1 hypothetical protein [Streptomyces turgidiscabies]GAQ69299.1 hypothetical protein T45_01023 [Streptomyces turgidiscabies]